MSSLTIQLGVQVTLDGSNLDTDVLAMLESVRIEQSLLVPGRFELRFRDLSLLLGEKQMFKLGGPVDLAVMNGQVSKTVMRGEIGRVTYEADMRAPRLVVSGYDRARRLAQNTTATTYTDLSDADIVAKIARSHGLEADSDATAVNSYLLQIESDYAFLQRRAAVLGCEWWVDREALHFLTKAGKSSSPELRWGDNLEAFRLELSGPPAGTQVTVRGWDPGNQQAIVGQARLATGASAVGTDAPAASTQVSAASSASMFTGTFLDGARLPASPDEATAVAAAYAQRMAGQQVHAEGRAHGDSELVAGCQVKVSGVDGGLDGTYLLTSVEHVLTADDWSVRFEAGGTRDRSLAAVLVRRGRSPADDWRQGVVVGVVTNIDDPEGLGRVKVHFPTISDDDESAWARLAAPGAGPSRGILILPEVNDEVLVGFAHGDLRAPFVLGGLWSAPATPPQTAAAVIKDKKIVSRAWTSRLGHCLEFLDGDTDADKAVIVTLADGKTTVRVASDGIVISSPKDIKVTAGGNFSISATGDVAISGRNLKLSAEQDLDAGGMQTTVSGQTSAKLQGATAEVNGDSTVKVSGGASAQVTAAIVQVN